MHPCATAIPMTKMTSEWHPNARLFAMQITIRHCPRTIKAKNDASGGTQPLKPSAQNNNVISFVNAILVVQLGPNPLQSLLQLDSSPAFLRAIWQKYPGKFCVLERRAQHLSEPFSTTQPRAWNPGTAAPCV